MNYCIKHILWGIISIYNYFLSHFHGLWRDDGSDVNECDDTSYQNDLMCILANALCYHNDSKFKTL